MKLHTCKQFIFLLIISVYFPSVSFAQIKWYEKPAQFDESESYEVRVFQEEPFLLHWPSENSLVPINLENKKPVLLIQHEQEELLKESIRQKPHISNNVLQLWFKIAQKTDVNYFIEPPIKLMVIISAFALLIFILMSFLNKWQSIVICVVSVLGLMCIPKYEIEYFINDSGTIYKIIKGNEEKHKWIQFKGREKLSLFEADEVPSEMPLKSLDNSVWKDYGIDIEQSGVHRGFLKESYFLDCK